jgi:hypothetical protein
LLLFNIISLVCDTLSPAVRKLTDVAQEEVSVATPEHPVSLPHYCKTFFRPDAPLEGRRVDSLRKQGPDYTEDVVERSISGFWMVSMVRASTCGRAYSWRNDTDVCALFLLFLMVVFHTTITDVQYSRQPADSYSPVLSNECNDVVTVLASYGSTRPALMRFILHRFPFLNALLHL